MPAEAKVRLAAYGEIIDFTTEGITYDAISGHPDIFFCPTPAGLIVAPNLPDNYFTLLEHQGIHYSKGKLPVGNKYPESARYNSLATNSLLIQNFSTADPGIQRANPDLETILVKQGYTRCNMVALPNGTFITSDAGIAKSLTQRKIEVMYLDPSNIKLDGFEHGFFGGVTGMYRNSLFVCGSLSFFDEKERMIRFIERAGVQIVELYTGQPVDVGTILFMK
jgi:hypothetical protein